MSIKRKPQRFAVIGLGRFGEHLACELASAKAEVIAIDRLAKSVERVRDQVTLAVRLDSTDEEALKAQGVHEVDVAIVSIGDDFESSALTVAILKSLGVPRVIARAETEIQARILRSVGADTLAAPEQESALRWAHRLMLSNLKQYIELGADHSIIYTPAPTIFHHKSLMDLDLRNQFGVNLIAIERQGGASDDDAPEGSPATKAQSDYNCSTDGVDGLIVGVPGARTIVLPGDILVLAGSNQDLSALPAV